MSKLRIMLCIVGFFLCAASGQAQWQSLGFPPSHPVNPNCGLTTFPCYTPSNATPLLFDWMKATYDPLDKGIIIYANSPYCCFDASNAVFVLNTANAIAKGTVNVSDGSVWSLKWSNNDHIENGSKPAAITSISRASNVVTVNLASPGTRARVGEMAVVWGVSDPSFNGMFKVAGTSSNPPETQFTYNQTGPDTGPILNIGKAGGPTDALHQPSDREPYHQITWDTKRNFMWQFGGDAYGVNNPGQNYCAECQAADLYQFDFNQPNVIATQICGNFTAKCGASKGVDEGAIAYDPVNDVIVLFGGLVGGTQVNDTWEYAVATNTWTHTCTLKGCIGGGLPPAIRNREGLVYDPPAGAFIMFSGITKPTVPLNDTWAYSVTTHRWTQLSTTLQPPAEQFPVMDYDPDRQSVVFISPNSPAQTWELTNVNVGTGTAVWTNLNIPGGPTLNIHPANNYGAYDQNAKRFVVFMVNSMGVWSVQLP